MAATKARRLPRPWPLLAQGQDPEGLEARVAFHLHRLKLIGHRLRALGYDPNDAADLAAARMPLRLSAISALAARLELDRAELTRPLTHDEQRVWAFYRASAADPSTVWRNARAIWRAHYSDQQAADIMGLNVSLVWRATARGRVVLSFERAARLTTALNIADGPEAFLPRPARNDAQRSR